MRVSRFGSRAIGFGLVFAMAGFAFAVSTGPSAADRAAAGPRSVGATRPLRFTTPNMINTVGSIPSATEYDLGDALQATWQIYRKVMRDRPAWTALAALGGV